MTDKKKGKLDSFKESANNFPVVDYAEALLDACVESEILKQIPVLSVGIGTVKTYLQFREGKFKKKVEEFVRSAGAFTSEDWENFSSLLDKDRKKEHFIDELFEAIERADSEQKAKVLGGVFRRLVKQEIAYGQFEDQVNVTNAMLTLDIHYFMQAYHNSYTLEDALGDILVVNRLAKRKVELAEKTTNVLSGAKEQYVKTSYEVTGFGYLYLATLHQVYKDVIDPEFLYVG